MSERSSSTPAQSCPTDSKSNKHKEKDDMVGLNDKFVQLIDKVKHLEDEKRKLETKLKILKDQGGYEGKIDNMVRQVDHELQQKIDKLLLDQEKLQVELLQNQKNMEDTKKRYQEELQKKDDLEKEFMITKKEADNNHMQEVMLKLELEDLIGKLEFLRAGFDEEIRELESQVQNKTVILRDSSKRSLDMDDFIETVKIQYANMATRARSETEHWHQRKIETMVEKVEKGEQDVRDIKREIADMTRHMQRLNGDLEALKRKEDSLKKEIDDSRTEGENNLDKARKDIAELEAALRNTKKDLAGQIREYQELMNLKLSLDIEIATYRKLLEGEEERINVILRQADVHLPLKKHLPEKPRAPEPTIVPPTTVVPATTVFPADAIMPPVYPASKKRLLIRVEVKAGRVVSESSQYTED